MVNESKAVQRNVPSRNGSTQKMGANIQVVVRVRPPNQREVNGNSRIVVELVDDRMLVFDPKEDQRLFFYQGVQQPNRNYLKRANKELKFVFDAVFGQNAVNRDVFESTTKEMLASLMEGYNCSVFAYGATGAGKTFTMIGNKENPGITFLTMEHLFYSISTFENDREFDIGVSYIEVYNENVFDLLNPSKHALQLREDAHYGVMVAGLTLHKIKTAPELLNMLDNGNKNRTQHPTDANAESSRSHAVFQVYITMKYKISGQVRMVKLSMIDLAGSERACATGCVRERFKEGANINRSLLALGNVINTLADGGKYVPYRDSKLTRLLKDSLGGNCKTVMIANVSPSNLSYEDTYNTLKYAARANKIQLSVKKTLVNSDMRLSAYVEMIEQLKKKVKELETKLTSNVTQSAVKERDNTRDRAKIEWIRRIKGEERKHAALETQLLQYMSMARVLALRHRNKSRALDNIANLAHRSSSEAVEQLYSEDLPRQERSAEHYNKQSATLDAKIMCTQTEWIESRNKLRKICDEALAECPELVHFIDSVHMRSEVRKTKAENELKDKLLAIEIDEINAFTEYTSDMPKLLKTLYLTIKGYDKVTPALTEEYVNVMRKAKSTRNITWSDGDNVVTKDTHLKFITTLDLDKPLSVPDLGIKQVKEEYQTIEIDSEELTDTENKEPLKRKATPIKIKNEETILIEDSFEQLDVTKNLSAKKPKRDFGKISPDFDNFTAIDAKDLNSTFVLADKELAKKIKFEAGKVLSDTTNMMTRSDIDIRPKPMQPPSLTRSVSLRRPVTAPPMRTAAFGSTLSRDARPKVFGANGLKTTNNNINKLDKNNTDVTNRRNFNTNDKYVGFKAMRTRDRAPLHPYNRITAKKY